MIIALLLVALVGGVTWFGSLGRILFAIMCLAFIAVATAVLVYGFGAAPSPSGTVASDPGHMPVIATVLAFPVAMALATGIEAPSTAIAELGQLDDAGRRRFGQITLWLTLGIVGAITMGLAFQASYLQIGIPEGNSTQIAELARVAAPAPLFAAFQLATALLLLSAASSSFQAGPGLLKALARKTGTTKPTGVLPAWLGRTNSRFTPYCGVLLFVCLAAALTAAAGGEEQKLVLFYAVAVFLSFLAGLAAMAYFSYRDGRTGYLVMNAAGVLIVAFTLVVNLFRGLPLVSLAAALVIAAILHRLWTKAGRPEGVRGPAAVLTEKTGGHGPR